jgi:predicted nucleic acid-binding protein
VTDALADTSLFIGRETGRPLAIRALPDRMAVSVITVGELWAGVLAAKDLPVRDRRLATLMEASRLSAIPIDREIAETLGRLRQAPREAGLRLGVNDSWIAATAMAHALPLVTQDANYIAVPGLEIIRV